MRRCLHPKCLGRCGKNVRTPGQPVCQAIALSRFKDRAKSSCSGKALQNCTYTRRTLSVSAAATLSSLTQMVPAVALASSVPCKLKARNRSNNK